MKNKKEILARAIVLLCVFDRAFLEMEKIGGKTYSFEKREEQRKKIYNWLKRMGYLQYMTSQECDAFKESVGGARSDDIFSYRFQYEALAVLLWALRMYEMPNGTRGVMDDFHSYLSIGANHNFDELLKSCQLRSEEELVIQTEVAMLWHWRTIEIGNMPKNGRSWGDCIKMIFGEEYEKMLSYIPQAKETPCDFLVGGKPVAELNRTEQQTLDIIAYWRHYAFEWIMGDDAWDEVSADT